MVVHKINIKGISVRKPEDNSPIGPNGDSPITFPVTLKRVQAVARKIQIPGRHSRVQDRKDVFNLLEQVRPDAAYVSILEQAPQTAVAEGPDHTVSVN